VAARKVAGVVLAAGAGTRMGQPKAELRIGGTRLVDRAVTVLRDGGCEPVLAVVRTGVPVPDARVVVNQRPERGMRSSLDLAIAAAAGTEDVEAVAVLLVDAPGVGAQAVRQTVQAWRPGRIAVATFAAGRGHPIVMSPAMWRAAVEMAGPDEGARAYLAANAALVDAVPVPGDPADVDMPRDLVRWQSAAGRDSGGARPISDNGS
jgi:molybdenum cofactor cytidylyltransferase/nicotine blue oxidoreductase